MARRTLVRIVDPQTGQEITTAGVPGELRIKVRACSRYLPASRVPDPFDDDVTSRPGPAGDHRGRVAVPALCRPVQGRGGARGMKISAAELEGSISGYPAVADVAVVAYPTRSSASGPAP